MTDEPVPHAQQTHGAGDAGPRLEHLPPPTGLPYRALPGPTGGMPPPVGRSYPVLPPLRRGPVPASMPAGAPTRAQGRGPVGAPVSAPWWRGAEALAGAAVAAAAIIALLSAVVGGVSGVLLATAASRGLLSGGFGAGALPPPSAGRTTRPPGSIASIAATVLPSVVTIKVKGRSEAGTGSGFVIRSDGYILTNNHVVAVAASGGSITVEWSDGSTTPATVVGRDDSYDLAVIRVRRTGLRPLRLANSAKAVVGDQVIAVGAPLGLESTVTSGIISALNRPVSTGDGQGGAASYINAIQTDAAINPGNSGGPLLDMSGAVVGINSAIARVPDPLGAAQSGSIGVGFCIPSDQARITAGQLIATGKASHPAMGVLLDPAYTGPGVRIPTKDVDNKPPITAGGPAARAGLQRGDVLERLDGTSITDSDQFIVAVRAHAVGDRIRLLLKRGSREQTVTVTLQAATD